MRHELCIITNDGWVVTLVSDKPISIGEAQIETIIVQPHEDYTKRVAEGSDGIARQIVGLKNL
jgi:sporulation protein YlmC with PRC-barrel domain